MRHLSICLVLLCTLALGACGGAGPTKKEAAEAVNELASEVAKAFSFGSRSIEPAKIEVGDLKCSVAGQDIYDCAVLLKRDDGNEGQDNYRFTKLGGKWRAERI
ncbi:MAG: hypothetical protein F9K29_23795 [Hyphomicrobiaceae bacterium]|nr:MAG: hypothetical protein F9K29_23795 [Hyphomicrobiaceae bacterium]